MALVAAIWALSHAPKAHAQEFVPVASADADASGGDGGSARGGDGGRGGDGVLPTCNGNANSVDLGDEDALECGAGGAGGAGGDAGESVGGNGGIAFAIGGGRRPEEPEPEPATPLADLAVSHTGTSAASCANGCQPTHTVTVTNLGPALASAVTLVDAIRTANGAAFVPVTVTPSQGTCTSTLGPSTSHTVNCTLGSLASGATATIQIHYLANLGSAIDTLTASASAATPTPETTLANNQASFTTNLNF